MQVECRPSIHSERDSGVIIFWDGGVLLSSVPPHRGASGIQIATGLRMKFKHIGLFAVSALFKEDRRIKFSL